METSRYELVSGSGVPVENYLRFARKQFGEHGHQASADYLKWLYSDSPLGVDVETGFHVAVDEKGDTVGCVHTLHMPWRWKGNAVVVPASHNLMVAPEHRRGVGGLLIERNFFGKPHVMVPGAVGKLADVYRRMGLRRASTVWRARWINPVGAMFCMICARGVRGWRPRWKRLPAPIEATLGSVRVTNFRPAGAKDLDEAAQFANGFWTEKEAFSQDWNSELFFWRFFHPRGPRHVMTVLRRAEKIVAFAVTSLGVRKGVRLARIVDWRASSICDLTILLRQVVRELRKAGGHLAVVSSGESGHNDLLKGTAWSVWGRAPESFFLHRRCKEPLPHAFMASAGDFGFDAFETGGGTRMNTTGTFMISFDCEGKWGRADFLTPALENTLTSAAIEAACGQILASFRGHRLKGTFAFVGAFTLTPDEYHEISERLPDVVIDGKPWLGAFRAAGARRTFDGWLVPEARLRVQAEGVHEIATHGFTHLPLGESVVTPEVFDRELELAREESARQGWTARTLIYPRNHVGYTERLERHGVIGYRELLWPTWRGAARKLRSLAAEFGFGGRSQEQTVPSNPVEIPSGYLLNFWHNRSRRWISREATRRRWRTIMADAARVGGCVHLWSHPENFVADPGLIEVFDDILADAASFVRAGQLKNVTQEEYCLARLQEQKSFKTVVA